MMTEIVYRGENFFRSGEAFCMFQFPEPVKEKMQPHVHDFVEICYVCSGSGGHKIGDQQFRVSKGDIFLINYDTAHAFYRDIGDEELITYNLLFRPGFLNESLLSWDAPIDHSDLRLNAEEQDEFDRLIVKMEYEYTRRPTGYSAIIRACMTELIVKFMRSLNRGSENDDRQSIKAGAVEAAIRHLNENYKETVSLAELANIAFINKNYFCNLFKAATGMTVSEYTRKIRINEACRMIVDPDKTWIEVSLEVGYSDYKSFYMAFKKHTGISPNEYKASVCS